MTLTELEIMQAQYIVDELRRQQQDARVNEFNNRKRLSLMGARYANVTLANATVTPSNADAIALCKKYLQSCVNMLSHAIGLYFVGDNGTGKTYLTACLCNDLVAKGYYCLYTNLSQMLGEIQNSRNDYQSENALFAKLQTYDFVFIDDLGKEFLGREYDTSKVKWAEKKLFEIINLRYNASKPTIFSSNYTIAELATVLKLDKAIVDRIFEMSTRIITLKGDDFRVAARKQAEAIATELINY